MSTSCRSGLAPPKCCGHGFSDHAFIPLGDEGFTVCLAADCECSFDGDLNQFFASAIGAGL